MVSLAEAYPRVLGYLREVHRENPQAEVSALELGHELNLQPDLIRECIEYLVREGLVVADLFPKNVWVRLVDDASSDL